MIFIHKKLRVKKDRYLKSCPNHMRYVFKSARKKLIPSVDVYEERPALGNVLVWRKTAAE